MADAACIFCAIVSGAAPFFVVAEDETTLAFLDIFPLTRGHTLVIPKRHAADLLDAPADDVAAVARMAQRVAIRLRSTLDAPGINLLQATGAIALQTVFHLHVHVLPRYPDDASTSPSTASPATLRSSLFWRPSCRSDWANGKNSS